VVSRHETTDSVFGGFCVRFVVDEVTLRRGFIQACSILTLLIIILPLPHTHLSPLSEVRRSFDQASHYLILMFKASLVGVWLRRKKFGLAHLGFRLEKCFEKIHKLQSYTIVGVEV
jgi:hypothetical protein